ncbi:hypothetical protein ACIPY3_20385 [Paenarthrobacter sp. NPDC089714]|uniref:hypothetical protein n=1 Tax=Paenarthrobacter sp. NPDC089714 TaxID=3364377 RepID=UPI003813A80E
MARRSANIPNSLAQNPRPRRGRTAWLVVMGLLAGIAGGAFAWRMLAPDGEPVQRGPVADAQPQDLVVPTEPVEISTRMRPGEWTEESLQEHLEDYKQQIRDMGASESQIIAEVERTEGGAAKVVVRWDRSA